MSYELPFMQNHTKMTDTKFEYDSFCAKTAKIIFGRWSLSQFILHQKLILSGKSFLYHAYHYTFPYYMKFYYMEPLLDAQLWGNEILLYQFPMCGALKLSLLWRNEIMLYQFPTPE